MEKTLKRIHIFIYSYKYITESLWHTPETNTISWIKYTSIKKRILREKMTILWNLG